MGLNMFYTQRELDRIESELHNSNSNQHMRLYDIQQSLSWVMELHVFASPYDMVMGTQEGSGDCSADLHPLQS